MSLLLLFGGVKGDVKAPVGGGYDDKKKRKYVVKVGERLMVFSNQSDALNALPESPKKQVTQKVIRQAEKKAEKVIPLAEIKSYAAFDYQKAIYEQMIRAQRYEALIRAYEEWIEREAEEILMMVA